MPATEEAVQFEVVCESRETAEQSATGLQGEGADTAVEEAPGLLPLAVLLVVVIPPGVALLAKVINRIILDWKRHGVVIDARGTRRPRLIPEKSLPYGTVVILTRDGDEAKRSELPEEKLSDYISAALTAVTGGASASDADKKATDDAKTDVGAKQPEARPATA